MAELSPIAQIVMEEAWKAAMPPGAEHPVDAELIAAVAIRAAALHLDSEEHVTCEGNSYAMLLYQEDLLALADELEALK